MYYGSAMSFLGTALLYGKPAGVALTGEVLAVYLAALQFEEYVWVVGGVAGSFLREAMC